MYTTVAEYVYHCILTVYQSISLCIPRVYDNVYKTWGSKSGASETTFGTCTEARLRAPIAPPLLTKNIPYDDIIRKHI